MTVSDRLYVTIGAEDYKLEVGADGLKFTDNRDRKGFLRLALFHTKQVCRSLKRFVHP